MSENEHRQRIITGKRLALVLLAALVGAWPGAVWLGARFPRTVAQDVAPPIGRSQSDYGYRVQQYRWQRTGFRVKLWYREALRLEWDLTDDELIGIRTQRWLAGHTAILLELDCSFKEDSLMIPGQLALLYDFNRGLLWSWGSNSGYTRIMSNRSPARTTTREEFDRAIRALEP